jgi:hypothetical protein
MPEMTRISGQFELGLAIIQHQDVSHPCSRCPKGRFTFFKDPHRQTRSGQFLCARRPYNPGSNN